MSTPKNQPEPKIHQLRLSALVIDPALSGRSPKEIKANAEKLSPAMKARGGWDIGQPGQIFMRQVSGKGDPKPHLSAGFTRVQAAEMAGIKDGYFIEVPDDPAMHRKACIITNLSQGISPFEQGRVFAGMRDGNAATAKKGETVFEPMKVTDIAKELGVSHAWVVKCLAIFDSPAEIRQLVESEKVAANVVYDAHKLAKGDKDKQVKMIKAAVEEAEKQGKETATGKHLAAVKDRFLPKLKADTSGNGKGPTKKDKDKEGADGEKEEAPPAQQEWTGEESDKDKAPAKEAPAQPQSTLELGTPAPAKKSTKKDRKDTIAFIRDLIIKGDEGLPAPMTIEEGDAEGIAEFLVSNGIGIVSESPL